MGRISGIDHVAVTVSDLEQATRFYRHVLAAETAREHIESGAILIRQVVIGGALLSLHQQGNGFPLVAEAPTVGAVDLCFTWEGGIESAVALLRDKGIALVEGPVARHTAGGVPSQSVYFRDPDGNLIELMAADPQRGEVKSVSACTV